jgi:hypothetical protein
VKGVVERKEDGLQCSDAVEMPAGEWRRGGEGGAAKSAVAKAT